MRAIEYGVTPSTPSIHSRLARPRGPSSFFTLGRSARAGELIKCEGGTLVAFFYPGANLAKLGFLQYLHVWRNLAYAPFVWYAIFGSSGGLEFLSASPRSASPVIVPHLLHLRSSVDMCRANLGFRTQQIYYSPSSHPHT
eukprot:COSAG04_NODE_916_length_9432_cov_11.719383_7_plen_140_part_00